MFKNADTALQSLQRKRCLRLRQRRVACSPRRRAGKGAWLLSFFEDIPCRCVKRQAVVFSPLLSGAKISTGRYALLTTLPLRDIAACEDDAKKKRARRGRAPRGAGLKARFLSKFMHLKSSHPSCRINCFDRLFIRACTSRVLFFEQNYGSQVI